MHMFLVCLSGIYWGAVVDTCLLVCLMVFNATFNNILVIPWRSVLLVEETGGLGENHRLYHIMLYTSPPAPGQTKNYQISICFFIKE
jgi:hypothetical protein